MSNSTDVPQFSRLIIEISTDFIQQKSSVIKLKSGQQKSLSYSQRHKLKNMISKKILDEKRINFNWLLSPKISTYKDTPCKKGITRA